MGTITGPLVRRSLEATGLEKVLTKCHPLPISVNKVYWNIAMSTGLLSMAIFMLPQQSCIIATVWPKKPKLFTILPFTEKVCQPQV